MKTVGREEAATLLHQYSEWLDGEGVIIPESELDGRTHDDLVKQFLDGRITAAQPQVTA